MVNLMFGPNAPKLQRLIVDELKQVQAVKDGAAPRQAMNIMELSNEERERQDKVDAVRIKAEQIESEAKEKAHHEREMETCKNILGQYEKIGVVLALPMCKDIVLAICNDMWESNNLFLHKSEKITLKQEQIEELSYFAGPDLTDEIVDSILELQSLALMIETAEDYVGDPIDRVLQFCFGPYKVPPGSKDCLNAKIREALELQM